ncbi:MAG: ABC transporter permease, partial [Proteobacteria bacterium]|nr:ABC transporter permease [Pseudomonadota bacterium]
MRTKSVTVEQTKSRFSPETLRKWRAFRQHHLGFWSALLLALLTIASVFAEAVSNTKPIVIRYQGEWYFPMVKSYQDKTFGGIFET